MNEDQTTGGGDWTAMLKGRLIQNQAASIVKRGDDGSLSLGIPTRKPRFLVWPLTWLIRPPEKKVLHLDAVGARLWLACGNAIPVEDLIENFAIENGLTFHEARVSVTTYAKSLVQRGALAVAMWDGSPAEQL